MIICTILMQIDLLLISLFLNQDVQARKQTDTEFSHGSLDTWSCFLGSMLLSYTGIHIFCFRHLFILHNRLQLVIMSIKYKHSGDVHQNVKSFYSPNQLQKLIMEEKRTVIYFMKNMYLIRSIGYLTFL